MIERKLNESTMHLLKLLAGVLFLFACAVASLVAAPAAAGEEGAKEDALKLADVNGEAITLGDIRASFGSRHSGHAGLLVGPEIIKRVVDQAVAERLMIQEGYRMGIPEEPGFVEWLEAEADLARLRALEHEVIDLPSRPDEKEVREAYQRLHEERWVGLIETPDAATAAAARERAEAGESFEDLARELSIHPSRSRGGDLGWITWGVLDPVTESMVMEMNPGQISAPFRAGEHVHLVKLNKIRVGEPPEFAVMRDRLAAVLAARAGMRIRSDLLESIRAERPPFVDEQAVADLLSAPSGDADDEESPGGEKVLLRTGTGLTLLAGKVRARARRGRMGLEEAWRAASEDALLMDEARIRMKERPEIENQIRAISNARVRSLVEETAVLRGLSMDEEKARKYFERDPASFAGPRRYHIRHILLSTREEADSVRKEISAGAEFAELARTRSRDHASASRGGDLGWVDAPKAGGKSQGAVADLGAGEISGVIETPAGFAIVQVLEIREPEVPGFDAVRHEAAKRWMIEEQRKRREAFVERLREGAEIRIYQEAVDEAARIQDDKAGRRLDPGTASMQGARR